MEQRRIGRCVSEGSLDRLDEVRLQELSRRKIHVHVQRLAFAREPPPRLHLFQRLAQNPIADLRDQSCLFRDRNDFVRRHEFLAALPANERFESADASRHQRDDRLIVHAQFAAIDGAAQIRFDFQQTDGAIVHRLVEHFMSRLTARLGAVHGDVGVAQHFFRIGVTGHVLPPSFDGSDDGATSGQLCSPMEQKRGRRRDPGSVAGCCQSRAKKASPSARASGFVQHRRDGIIFPTRP